MEERKTVVGRICMMCGESKEIETHFSYPNGGKKCSWCKECRDEYSDKAKTGEHVQFREVKQNAWKERRDTLKYRNNDFIFYL